MKIFDQNTGKILRKNTISLKFEPFFCPYCEIIFIKNYNSYSIQDNKFHCSECNKKFIEKTYLQEKRKRRNYQLPTKYNQNETVQEIIKSEILKLWKEGYSQREIIKLTKFPKSKVEEYTLAPKKAIFSISIEKFKKDYLKINDEINKDKQIASAIEFGCTVRQMQELFEVGNDRIARVRANHKIKILRKNKITINGDKVKIFKLSK